LFWVDGRPALPLFGVRSKSHLASIVESADNQPMPKPTPTPPTPAEARVLALEMMQDRRRFPQLASIDGDQPRTRPVSPVRTDDFVVYVANLRQYHKTTEIDANPKVELCYMDDGHNQVRVTGQAHVETDMDLLAEIWQTNPLLRQYLGTPDNPDLIVYRIEPVQVRYMKEWALNYVDVSITP
jgi:uncharacterized pyridoxamine 5'-phosphate oxidase family protein